MGKLLRFLVLACVAQVAGAQGLFKGFVPDENGTNLDDPQASKTVQQKVAPGSIIKDCPECPEMVVIPAGNFVMGSDAKADEKPQHSVRVSSFLMGKTEITQEQWTRFMGSNPSRFYDCGPNCPVENVSWNDIEEFIRELNKKTSRKYRLPTEAEWEYAARAGTATDWSFGDDATKLGNYAWYSANSRGNTHEVAQKLRNSFGLFDMHGNVWEWTQDYYKKTYDGSPSDSSPWNLDSTGKGRVLRGGSWDDYPGYLRSAYRYFYAPSARSGYVGFRVTRNLAEDDGEPKRALGLCEIKRLNYTNLSEKYASNVVKAIRPNVTFNPDGIFGNPAVDIQLGLADDGTIQSRTVVRSSGLVSWDTAALMALGKTERLPKDEEGCVPINLVITLRPKER